MIILNPKYVSGQECLSLTYSEEIIQEYLDNQTTDQFVGLSEIENSLLRLMTSISIC